MEISLLPPPALNSPPLPGFLSPHPYVSSSYRLMLPPLPLPEPSPDEPFSPLPEPNNFKIDDFIVFSCDGDDAADSKDDPDAASSLQADVHAQDAVACSATSAGAQAPLTEGPIPDTVSQDPANGIANSAPPQEAPYLHPHVDSHGLCAPPEELANQLEWLSAFNEDSSYSGDRKLLSLVSSGGLCSGSTEEGEGNSASAAVMVSARDRFRSSSPVSVLEQNYGFSYILASTGGAYVPSRARSKRSRSHSRVWPSFDMLTVPTLLDNRLVGGEDESPVFVEPRLSSSPPTKKLKKAPSGLVAATAKSMAAAEASQRRCSHCLVQKTPQWRAGPMGPKTLCNACGVRYKSGRLVPEYRPAGSPSFVSEVHSNSHKKILEMRRLKEAEEVHVYAKVKEAENGNDSNDDDDDDEQEEEEEEDEEDDEEGGDDGGSRLAHSQRPRVSASATESRGMKESSFSGSNSWGSMASACVGSSNSGGGDPSAIDSNAPLSKLSAVDGHGSCVERRALSGGISVNQEDSFLLAGATIEEDSRQEESVGSF